MRGPGALFVLELRLDRGSRKPCRLRVWRGVLVIELVHEVIERGLKFSRVRPVDRIKRQVSKVVSDAAWFAYLSF